jgi:hypothetical protein
MYPSTAYTINYEIATGSTITEGLHPVTFTTGPLPSSLTFPTSTVITPSGAQDDQADRTILHSYTTFNVAATDLSGNINWYYAAPETNTSSLLTRPFPGGFMLTLQGGNSWNPNVPAGTQFLREIDLSGNIIRETNVGVLQQELLAMGATDFGPCGAIALPAAVGSACLAGMHHDAIRLPNGDTLASVAVEKIFAPGTQGNTTGLNVDIIGDGFLALDRNFQLLWYFDSFQHDGGAPQLDINPPRRSG